MVLAVLERRDAAVRCSGWLRPVVGVELKPRSETEPARAREAPTLSPLPRELRTRQPARLIQR